MKQPVYPWGFWAAVMVFGLHCGVRWVLSWIVMAARAIKVDR